MSQDSLYVVTVDSRATFSINLPKMVGREIQVGFTVTGEVPHVLSVLTQMYLTERALHIAFPLYPKVQVWHSTVRYKHMKDGSTSCVVAFSKKF